MNLFQSFFRGQAWEFLLQAIDQALEEDGPDLTSKALFSSTDSLKARILAKKETFVVGLPLLEIILDRVGKKQNQSIVNLLVQEAQFVPSGSILATIDGPALDILKAERVILNFICHLSGIADLTAQFVKKLQGSKTKLLDTRKTLPGLRYPEKYAVKAAGGINHRLNLSQMLMLKDNHIDRAGSITEAVHKLRSAYQPCPPIEVECRNITETKEAVICQVDRIMLDNMSPLDITIALQEIPDYIETEVSGGITLENISQFAKLGTDFISTSCITTAAPYADLSLQITN